tara:strand:- start:456 stop:653 length:198 start_codon:yes stop_codon:yes gene_type:complete
MIITIPQAIKSLNSNAKFSVDSPTPIGEPPVYNVDTIRWHEGTTPIAKADILAEQTRLQEIEDAK